MSNLWDEKWPSCNSPVFQDAWIKQQYNVEEGHSENLYILISLTFLQNLKAGTFAN